MRNLKRVLSLALALVMVLGMMVITTSAADFTDAEEITYKEAVEVMANLGILKGYEAANGTFTFNPKGTLNRQEAAKILAFVCMGTKADDYLTGSTKSFDDVDVDHWAAKYIAYCKNLGIVNGMNDAQTLFNPTGTLTVAQFAKMLLVAVGAEGTFTGSEWLENVKNAFNGIPVLAATGIKITEEDPNITREEACHMALAAMKVGTEVVEYKVYDDEDNDGVIDDGEEVFSTYDNVRDAALDVQMLDTASTNVKYKKVTTTENLLSEMYKVTVTNPAYDDFGRPGYTYSWVEGEDTVEMFYANKALATFEGPAAQKAIYAASGEKEDATVTYAYYEDGVTDASWSFTAAKDNKDSTTDEAFAAGTGYGVKAELYQIGTGASATLRLVAVREYLGKVTAENDANPEDPTSKRSIDIEVYNLSENNDTDGTVNLVTEEYAEDDMVIVTVAGNKVQTIALAETVKGVVTKITTGSGTADNNYYTIGGEVYVKSQNVDDFDVVIDGEEDEFYLDSMGNLIGEVAGAPVVNPYIYGIVLGVDGKAYIKAGVDSSILGREDTEDGQAAAEVIKILTAEGKEVVYNTDWEYTYSDAAKTVISGVDFKFDEPQVGVNADGSIVWEADENLAPATNTLVKFKLDENGAIDTETLDVIDTVSAGDGAELKAGVATIGDLGKVITDKTVFFLFVDDGDEDNTDEKWVAYTGYKTVPGVDTFDYVYTVDSLKADGQTPDGTYAVVAIVGDATDPAPVVAKDYIYFADTAYTTEWDATAKDGKGAAVYVYENVYLNGVKTTVTFATAQTDAVKGEMYLYTVDAKTGALVIDYTDNLLLGADVVTLIHEDFYVANGVTYVNADTVYYQFSKTGMAKVEGLPTVKTTECIYVYFTTPNADPDVDAVATVYFAVVDAVELPEIDSCVWGVKDAGNDKYYVRTTFAEDYSLPAGAMTVVLKDEDGDVIAKATSIADHDIDVSEDAIIECPFWAGEHESDNWTAGHQDLGEDFEEDVVKYEVYIYNQLVADGTVE